jgi:hypothetical protein
MFEKFYKACLVHRDSKEEIREVVMLSTDEKKGIFLYDIEKIKIEAKKMELTGLQDGG